MGSIYTLSDPRTDEVRYVGKTTRRLGRRLTYHLRDAKLKNADGTWFYNFHAYAWVRSLLDVGVKPVIEEVEQCSTKNDLDNAERFFVDYFRALGFRLTNTKPGGEGGCAKGRVISSTYREKLAEAARRQWADPVKRAATEAGIRKSASTPEFSKKVSNGQRRAWATTRRKSDGHPV